jgi:LuxR family maltose regulon positive regulatory protein
MHGEKAEALDSLVEACALAKPVGIVTPFFELGRSMLALARYAASTERVSSEWLDTLTRGCAAYAKKQELISSRFRQENNMPARSPLSARELDIVSDLYNGLSRSRIAEKQHISINTVKTALKTIYGKLGAENNVDAVRIALESGILKNKRA